ncbi:helix-turn-helix transcriptional regulator [Streptomyces sp. WELS2]|uniref:helix-turn-helix domain-containing protein n=1 Tax=Streptomyces sp. WELS2 TaxID=2749435 RepID=UPI0015F0D67F|nr:helix-turn-helix transcriptional regulator [Streptomyces sp. WELS2]
MSSAGRGPVRGGWLDPRKPFKDGVRPRKRQLGLAMRALCRLLHSVEPAETETGRRHLKQAEAAERLDCTADELSRYLNDTRIPSQGFLERLHKEAGADADISGRDVGITLEALLSLHTSALAEQQGCGHCQAMGERIDTLVQQLNAPCPQCAAHERQQEARRQKKKLAARLRSASREQTRLRLELAELKVTVADLKAELAEKLTTEAGLRERLAAAPPTGTQLPVPRRPGDRQLSARDVSAARQLVAQAEDLDGSGREDLAFTLLQRSTAELLTPVETALVVVQLRHRRRDRLADDLIHVYGRDQKTQDVMAVALELHEAGAPDDAGAVLRAALG